MCGPNAVARRSYAPSCLVPRAFDRTHTSLYVCLSLLFVCLLLLLLLVLLLTPAATFYVRCCAITTTIIITIIRVQGLYLSTSRELKRLDALAFSPIFQHYAESLNGLPTIRAFQRQHLFEELNRVRGKERRGRAVGRRMKGEKAREGKRLLHNLCCPHDMFAWFDTRISCCCWCCLCLAAAAAAVLMHLPLCVITITVTVIITVPPSSSGPHHPEQQGLVAHTAAQQGEGEDDRVEKGG